MIEIETILLEFLLGAACEARRHNRPGAYESHFMFSMHHVEDYLELPTEWRTRAREAWGLR